MKQETTNKNTKVAEKKVIEKSKAPAKKSPAKKEETKVEKKVSTSKVKAEKKPTVQKVETKKAEKTTDKKVTRILFAASECQPFCSTGGLADVCGSLPKYIDNAYEGVDIRVVLPLYGTIGDEYRKDFKFLGEWYVSLAWRKEYCGVYEYHYKGTTYYFLDNERYFKRGNYHYGYTDDNERFAFFSKALLEVLPLTNFEPEIIHCNDWQTALVPVYLKTCNFGAEFYSKIKTVLCIHNIAYQGRFGLHILTDVLGIDKKYSRLLEFDKDANYVKAGVVCADKVVTVSPSYAEEIKTSMHANGLEKIMCENSYKLQGILNGIDDEFYDPQKDDVIYKKYSVKNINAKLENKLALQREFGLEENPDVPMLAVVARFPKHKGVDLIKATMENFIVNGGVQFVAVGEGEKEFEDYFKYLNAKYPKQAHISLGFNIEIGKKIYAAADIYLMPSLSEPCGLSQMIASRYGTVPIVRETGGLKDSIRDFGCEGGGNGYTFNQYNVQDFEYSVWRALNDFKNKTEWRKKIEIVMKKDFSWKNTAKQYVDLYKTLVEG